MDGFGGVGSGQMMNTFKQEGGIPDVVLLLLGEFQSVAEDLESRLFITESTCLGRLTAEKEHLPKKPRERHTDVHTGHMAERKRGGNICDVMSYAEMMQYEKPNQSRILRAGRPLTPHFRICSTQLAHGCKVRHARIHS